MGVIIKYQLEFPGFKVSNDLLKGDFIIDADIVASMLCGTAGGAFEITLYDLPKKKAEDLNEELENVKTPRVKILLGYFDGPFEEVMEGIYTEVKSIPKDDKLVTTVKGMESGTYAVLNTPVQFSLTDTVQISAVPKLLFDSAEPPKTQIARAPIVDKTVTGTLKDPAFCAENLMIPLGDLAKSARAELLVIDKKVRLGKPIKDDDYGPLKLDIDTNLAFLQAFSKSIPAETERNVLEPLPAAKVDGFKFIMVGDPNLRPGQRLVPNFDVFEEKSGEFRAHDLTHRFTVAGGYVCDGTAIRIGADTDLSRQADAIAERNASAFVQGLIKLGRRENQQRPLVEVAAVKTYSPGKHLGTLYFGQKYERTETQPSVRTGVEHKEEQLFRNKPIVSPFAWHKCGLIVPVYPGMKALLNHNLGLTDDALATGFLWSEKPTIEPPKNEAGDWWLCLPIDFDSSSPPKDDTKAANDLIANDGKRVIEVKGLKITVGKDKLATVGTRPTPGNDDELSIEHASGAKILIKDGEIQLTDGKVTLKVSGGKVDIS